MSSVAEVLSANLLWVRSFTAFDSQGKLAKAAKVDQKTISRMTNREHSPSIDKLERIAAVLGIEAWQLLAPDFGAGLYRLTADQRLEPVARPKAMPRGISKLTDAA